MTDLPPADIDRASPVPYYFQLAQLLKSEVQSGRWAAGCRLASEPELCEHFQVSRSTVRQALQRLESEGLITRQKGRGTFIGDNTASRSWMLQSHEGFFADEVDRLGSSVRSHVLHVDVGPLPRWATRALGLERDAVGVRLERLRSVDEKVALYVVNCLPAAYTDVVQSLSAEGGSLYDALHEHDGTDVYGGRRSVESVAAGEALADLLELDRGAPVAFIESVSWDEQLVPFDCYQAWLRTDRVRIEMQVARTPIRTDDRWRSPDLAGQDPLSASAEDPTSR